MFNTFAPFLYQINQAVIYLLKCSAMFIYDQGIFVAIVEGIYREYDLRIAQLKS